MAAYGVGLVEVPIVPDKLDEAFKVFTEHPHGLQYTSIQPGSLGASISCDAEKNSIIVMEKWVKKEDWNTYGATRRVTEGELGEKNAAWNAVFGPLVGGAPRMLSMDCKKSFGTGI